MEQPSIFRGTINGKEKYCRILVRRKHTPFDNLRPCAKCGHLPAVRHIQSPEDVYQIICHECLYYMEDSDAQYLADAWNEMNEEGDQHEPE